METQQLIVLLSRFCFTAFGAFLSILVWAKTRDIVWILIVMAILFQYIGLVYAVMMEIGILGNGVVLNGVDLAKIVLINLPMVFIISAFFVMLCRHKKI